MHNKRMSSWMRLSRATQVFVVSLVALGVLAVVLVAVDYVRTKTHSFSWQFSYDDNNRLTKATDPAGRDTRMRYEPDTAKRLRKVLRAQTEGPTVSREFDEQGRLERMTDGAGEVSYGYDELGRINRVQRQGTPATAYAYDTRDRVTRLEVGDFYRIDYVYDFLGRLESMKTPAGMIRYEHLTDQGKVVRTLPNGVKTIWEYEPNGRLQQITHTNGRNVILAEYTYQYRADGLIEAVRERSGTGEFKRSYEYDVVGRLIKASGPHGQQQSYDYDPVGNRVTAAASGQPPETYAYDWVGRLTAVNGKPAEHDGAGNLTSMQLAGTTLKYRHTQDGQLAEVLGGKAAYRYDGDGNLIARKAGALETTFIPDSLASTWRPLAMGGEGARRTLLIWEGATPTVRIRDGKPEYLLQDHLGSVRLVVDAQGQIINQSDYDPFGTSVDRAAATELSPGFAGLFWDPVASVYLTRARAYSPGLGRFLQIDPALRAPFGSPKHLSLYAYCGGDPVNAIDIDGAAPVSVDSRKVWWDTFWNESRQNVLDTLDPTRAKEALAMYSAEHLANARGSGVAAGLTATALDIIGGYIPGKPASENQAKAQLAWSLAFTGGGLIFAKAAEAIDALSFGQTAGSLMINARDGDLKGALLDLTSMGFHLGNRRLAQLFPPGYQHELPFTTAAANKEKWFRTLQHVEPASALFSWGQIADSQRDTLGSLFTFGMGQFLNFVGKDSNWIGANRGGGEFSRPWQKDSLGRFPLGDTNVGITGKAGQADKNLRWDQAAKWHDTQDYVNWHAAKGTEVKVPWGNGQFKYFTSRGKESSDHDREVVQFAMGWRSDYPITDSPRTSQPVDLAVLRQKYPVATDPSHMAPTNVGGVYLSGAGQSLAGIGLLDGIARDRNGNLVLLGKDGVAIKLPPLRLDDIVTIFRSVYLYGEGPTVTIDPKPGNPSGPEMIIQHGKATENTYVGWVLYQADRLMKGYTLGEDNITKQKVVSAITDYDKVSDTIFFGGEDQEQMRKGGHWERFWIVPAEAWRVVGAKSELTLLDVPLKVRTQTMKWQNGKLVDDPDATSSPGALAFTEWFKKNYDIVAGEHFLAPPSESGITVPVPVFTELRRFALLTAIAEKLRDQGVPLPFWMREYEVRPVPFEKVTPSHTVTRKNKSGLVARVFGGVRLSPADEDVRNFTSPADLSGLPKADVDRVRAKLNLAGALENVVGTLAVPVEPLHVRTFTNQSTSYQTVSIPGAETKAFAPNRLDVVDLAAPVEGGEPIRLVRSYNSFFNPAGPWGKGWALDLPRLNPIQVPVHRTDKRVDYQIAYELITPLNSLYARFLRVDTVPALNGSRLQVPDQIGEFFGIADDRPTFLSGPVLKLIRKDGGVWYFSKSGALVATEQHGVRVVYERAENGRLTRVVGLRGREAVAFIELRYNGAGQIESAKAKGGKRELAVQYEYDASGLLSGVVSDSGRLGYRYQDSFITEVTQRARGGDSKQTKDTIQRRFEYGPHGTLTTEVGPDGARTEYRVTSDSASRSVVATYGDKTSLSDFRRYDLASRPVEARHSDGTKVSWSYPQAGGMVMDLTQYDGRKVRLTESADQRSRTVELGPTRKLVNRYDAAGRLTSMDENGQCLLRQEWSSDGRLLVAASETSAANLEYDRDGLVSKVIVAPPRERGTFKVWQATRLDSAGRAVEVTDYRGLQALMDYTDTGELRSTVIKREGKSYSLQIVRDDAGRIRDVKSSSGTLQYSYDPDGLPAKLEVEVAGRNSVLEWKSGLLQKVRQFDGGQFAVAYYEDGKRAGLPREIVTPNRLALAYEYNASNQVSQVVVGSMYRLLLDYGANGLLVGWSYLPH